MTFTAIEDIYRLAVIEQAASVALHAAALTRAQAPAGVQYVEAALRLLARAQSRDHEEERLVRRLSLDRAVRELRRRNPTLTRVLDRGRLDDPGLADAIADLIAGVGV
jgi:hypothetical protein